MARYTVELRNIVESGTNIFPFPYDFYDEMERAKFERDFIRHFYFREIGQETVEKFIHYLRDKMETVFPYYNEMMKTSTMQYEILNNYYMTETTKMNRENAGKLSGISSTVGQAFDDVKQENTENKVMDATSESSETHTGSKNETQSSETTRNGTTKTDGTVSEGSERTDTESSSDKQVKDGTTTKEQQEKRKFLDTPQGAVDLTDVSYLTTLNQDTGSSEENTDETITNTGSKTLSSNGTKDTTNDETVTTSGNDTTEGTATQTTNENISAESTGKQEETVSGNNSVIGEHRNTSDNNTRQYTHGEETEVIEHHRKGNIGVNTDSDMIQKHLELQKILKQIKGMFFEECEDLFMLTY